MGVEIKGVAPPLLHKIGKATGPVQEPGGAQSRAGEDASSDKVSLTAASLRLHSLEQGLTKSPAVDAERVEILRARIVDGTYSVDAERVASRLLDLEAALTGKV
jgi:negative regulator of flagellin synthesis FlgM